MPTPKKQSQKPATLTLACCNAFATPQPGEDGALPNTLSIPYGQWPHGEREHVVGGRKMRLNVLQIFNHESGLAIANGLAALRAKNHPGIPVYSGHPDAPEFAAQHPDKAAIGWITGAVANAGGLDLTIDWLRNPGRGFAFFSPYWNGVSELGAPIANGKAVNATMKINSLLSLGLLNTPNIQDFRLPNSAATDETTTPQEDIMSKLLLEKLGLLETATEEEAVAAIDKLNADLKAATDQLANAQPALANALKARNDLLIETALANGQISGAEKEAWTLRLANAFDPESKNLAALPKKSIKTTAATRGRAPTSATGEAVDLAALANAKMAENPGMDFDGAWRALKKEHPEYFAKA